ncbi:MAG TPA: MarR family transcriptional regulator [Thermoplasmata archaeon]|nr:MarR family transcriptional regulator [Thermoplasmata archaeon]
MAAAPGTADDRLGDAVARLQRIWMRLTRQDAQLLGLSAPQVLMLRGLAQFGEMPATRWAEIIGGSPSTASGLLDGLETAGLVRRTRATEDRRQVLVTLTPKGRSAIAKASRDRRRHWKAVCRGIPKSDLSAAAATLERIAERMATVSSPGPPAGSRRSAA